MDDVNDVLEEIGAHEIPQLVVYNKIDLLPSGMREAGIFARQFRTGGRRECFRC